MTRYPAVFVSLLLLAGCAGAAPAADPSPRSAVSAPVTLHACPAPGPVAAGGDVLPDLSFPCLGSGPDLALGTATGKATVLNLWAAWCGPCRAELPLFEQLYEQSVDGLSVLGLVERDTAQSSLAFAAETGLSFPSGLDEAGRLLAGQGLQGLPVTYFLRADGSVAYRQIGPVTSYDDLRGLVAEHLGVTVP